MVWLVVRDHEIGHYLHAAFFHGNNHHAACQKEEGLKQLFYHRAEGNYKDSGGSISFCLCMRSVGSLPGDKDGCKSV